MKTWIAYYARVSCKRKVVEVVEKVWQNNKPQFKKKRRQEKIVKTVPITIEIPMEEYTSIVDRFDNTAMQSDDRFYTVERKGIRPNKEIINMLSKDALKGYNTAPKELTTLNTKRP